MTTAPRDITASPDTDAPVDQTARLRQWRDRSAARLNAWFAIWDKVLSGQAAWLGAIAFVLSLQVVLIVQHRPWLDEWQALQLSVQSPQFADLLHNLRYEGHPPLWYAILRGLGAVFPDQTWALPAAALLIAIPVQLLILLAAPFSRAERLMLALSEFVLFEYLTLSRSLTLGFALMIGVAALWKRPRLGWLLIALLPLCDFLFGVVSLIFVGLRWRERKIFWPGAVLWAASGLFAAWSIRPMPDISSALLPKGPMHDLMLWMANIGALGLPLQWDLYYLRWNSPPPPGLGGFALIGFFVMAWIELRQKRDHAAAFWGFVLLTLVFSIAVYQLSIRHLMIAAALLIVLVWLKTGNAADEVGRQRTVWWRAWLLVIMVCGLITAAINLARPFDTAPEAVAAINRLGLRDKTWVPFPHSAGQGVAALNGMVFERLNEHCAEDFVRWNSPDEHSIKSAAALEVMLGRKVATDGHFYFLTKYPLADRLPLLRRVAGVLPGYDGESFFMYSVGEGFPDARPHGIACAGPHPPLRRTPG